VRFPVHLPLSLPRVFLCAVVIIEPPYSIPDPQELTARLLHNWLRLQAQNRPALQTSHRPELAQVKRCVPLTRNTESPVNDKDLRVGRMVNAMGAEGIRPGRKRIQSQGFRA
jgi:hypothetical protein